MTRSGCHESVGVLPERRGSRESTRIALFSCAQLKKPLSCRVQLDSSVDSRKTDKPPVGFKEIYLQTQEGAAHFACVNVRSLQRYVADGTYKRSKRGWPVHALIKRTKKEGIDSGSIGAAKGVADLRIKVARAERDERKNDTEKGLFISAAEAQEQRLAIIHWFVHVFDRAGSELASKIMGKHPADVRRIVKDYFDDIRKQATQNDR